MGIYELRHADAHLASREVDEVFSLVQVDQNAPLVTQGYQLLTACVSSLRNICKVIEGWSDDQK